MREIAKRADDPDGLVVGEAADDLLEFLTRRYLGVAMEPQRGLADALDNSEDLIALLGAHRFAEDTAEKPYVVTQRRVLVGCLIRPLHRIAVLARWSASVDQNHVARYMLGLGPLPKGERFQERPPSLAKVVWEKQNGQFDARCAIPNRAALGQG